MRAPLFIALAVAAASIVAAAPAAPPHTSALIATLQDFDWADEVLHAQIGREWYIPRFANLREALDYGDRCWSRILSNWTTVRDQGLTKHDNWWPTIYTQACRHWGVAPDPQVLAYAETYEGQRADLKTVSVSG